MMHQRSYEMHHKTESQLQKIAFHAQVPLTLSPSLACCLYLFFFLGSRKTHLKNIFSPETFRAIQLSHNKSGIVLSPETPSLSAVAQTPWLHEKSPYAKGK